MKKTTHVLDGRASLVLNIFGWGFGLTFGCVNIRQPKHGLEAAKTFEVELVRFIKIHCVSDLSVTTLDLTQLGLSHLTGTWVVAESNVPWPKPPKKP